jgi:hypothetical protein
MSDEGKKKGWGKTVLGWFVETDNPAAASEGNLSADELYAKYAQAEVTPSPVALTNAPTAGPGGAVDFEAVYRAAGMTPAELDHVKKAAELLRNLPADTPTEIKRQIVEASLKAFGFEIDKIVAAARNQERALDAYVKVNSTAALKANEDAEAQIRSLTEKIAALREEIEKRTSGQAHLASAADERKAQVQKVLDFFQPPAAPGAPK